MLTNGQITGANLGFPLTDTQTAAQSKKAGNVPLFKDFLNSSGSKADDVIRNNPVRNSTLRKTKSINVRTVDDTVKQRTFRELEKEMKVEARKAMIQGKKEPVADYDTNGETGETDTDISDFQKTDIMLNCLAQVMGVNADELVKLLGSAGIEPEELSSISESDTIETKLAQAFGLDGKMGGALGKILKLIDSQVEEAISKVLQDESAQKTQWVKLDDMKVKVVLSKENSADTAAVEADTSEMAELSGLMLKFKLKLKEMGEELEQNGVAMMEEIKFKIHPVLKNASAMLKVSFNPVETKELSDVNTGIGESMVADTTAVKESDPAHSENGTEQTADSDAMMPRQASSKPETTETAQAFGNVINQLQSKEPEANPEILRMKTPVTDREILTQVIEKAKVVLTADKSEMVIELKPDSLGKLSLKVVTEHGIVMAGFVAESQQVKQILETNMQLLKESLEKQGLNVQGFSVSLRQESQNKRNDYDSHGDGRQRVLTVQIPGSGRIYADAAHIERLQLINPYRQEGNTINLTA